MHLSLYFVIKNKFHSLWYKLISINIQFFERRINLIIKTSHGILGWPIRYITEIQYWKDLLNKMWIIIDLQLLCCQMNQKVLNYLHLNKRPTLQNLSRYITNTSRLPTFCCVDATIRSNYLTSDCRLFQDFFPCLKTNVTRTFFISSGHFCEYHLSVLSFPHCCLHENSRRRFYRTSSESCLEWWPCFLLVAWR